MIEKETLPAPGALRFKCSFCPPTATAQQRRVRMINGHPQFYDPPALKAAKTAIEEQLRPHVPEKPFDQAVRMWVQWNFSYKSGHKDGDYRDTRPDTDNLQKALKDIMTKLGFWVDDALVVDEWVVKRWNKSDPGLYIRVVPVPAEPKADRKEQEDDQ